jgi:hypothetical protein
MLPVMGLAQQPCTAGIRIDGFDCGPGRSHDSGREAGKLHKIPANRIAGPHQSQYVQNELQIG